MEAKPLFEKASEATDALATELANKNLIEEAWRLRGFMDGAGVALGIKDAWDKGQAEDPLYGREYCRGYDDACVLFD